MHASVMSRTRGLCVLAAVCLGGSAFGQSDDMTPVVYTWGPFGQTDSVPGHVKDAIQVSRPIMATNGDTAGHMGVLLESGEAFFWGDNSFSQCDPPTGIGSPSDPIHTIDVGEYHTIALMQDGRVVCWGDNSQGECEVPGELGDQAAAVVDVAAGQQWSAALLGSGRVFIWGLFPFAVDVKDGVTGIWAADRPGWDSPNRLHGYRDTLVAIYPQAVSYTHLTLPTILRV